MASAYLQRTGISAGNRRTFTFSAWVKRSGLGEQRIFNHEQSSGTSQISVFKWDGSDKILFADNTGSGNTINLNSSNMVFRDVNAWYHLVLRVDTTDSTANNRARIYVNGSELSGFSTYTQPSQNYDTFANQSGNKITIGAWVNNTTQYFDGQMAHVHFTDGYSYGPTTFGETDSTTGIWKPKTSPSVTYGTNGFFLKMDNSGNMGLDSSGQSNNFTTSGTIIQNKDTPSNVFATMNFLNKENGGSTLTLVNTKLVTTAQNGGPYTGRTIATLGASSGKYYWEIKVLTDPSSTYPVVAIVGEDFSVSASTAYLTGDNAASKSYITYKIEAGTIAYNFTGSRVGVSYGSGASTNDIIGVALDLDNGKVFFSKNGTWVNSGDPVNGTNPASSSVGSLTGDLVFPAFGDENYSSSATLAVNFGNGYFGTTAVSSAQNPDDGNGIFEYDVPAGYRALCTKSLNAEEYS